MSPQPRASTLATVDVCAFRLQGQRLQLLIVQRETEPHMHCWALPGSVVNIHTDANLEGCAKRAVLAKTGVRVAYLEQVSTVGNGTRDPRGWSLAVIHMALLPPSETVAPEHSLAVRARWVDIEQSADHLSAFDHKQLLQLACARLQSKSRYSSLPIHLLPPTFTLAQLQRAFEICTGCSLERKAFRRRMMESGVIEETGEHRNTGARPAAIYRAHPEHSLHLFARTVGTPHNKPQSPSEEPGDQTR